MTTTYTTHWYALAFAHAFGGLTEPETTYFIDYLTDTIKCSLHTVTYVPNQDTDGFWNVCTNEVSPSGTYAAGGATLASKTMTEASKVVTLSAAAVQWTSFTGTFRDIVIYKSTGTASTSPLLAYVLCSADVVASNQTVNVNWNASGIVKLTVS